MTHQRNLLAARVPYRFEEEVDIEYLQNESSPIIESAQVNNCLIGLGIAGQSPERAHRRNVDLITRAGRMKRLLNPELRGVKPRCDAGAWAISGSV